MEIDSKYYSCFCTNPLSEIPIVDLVTCQGCKKDCHRVCYLQTPSDNPDTFFCVNCRLLITNPFYEIQHFILDPVGMQEDGHYFYNFSISLKDFERIKLKKLRFVIYCMNIQGSSVELIFFYLINYKKIILLLYLTHEKKFFFD